jgi:uncharacterized protein
MLCATLGWHKIEGKQVLRNALNVFLTIFMVLVLGQVAQAEDSRSVKLNQGTVGLLASQPELLDNALKIANSIDHTDGMRVLPIIGRGGLQSINDLLFLRGVDVAMLSSDSLAYVKKNGLYKDEADKVSLLAKLANVNIIVVARKEFSRLESLQGKRVATGTVNSDEFVAADLVFGDLDIKYERVSVSGKDALAALQDGRVDAAIFSGAASQSMLASVKKNSGLHILPVALAENLSEAYAPAILTSAEFPNLISDGTAIETVAAALVLAVFDWPNKSERFYKLRKFNDALFANYFPSLGKQQNTNFLANVPGWKAYFTPKEITGSSSEETQSLSVVQ